MKKIYLSLLSIAALTFSLNAQVQVDQFMAVPNGPPSSSQGNCNILNMGGALASGYLAWEPGDGSLYTWFDISGSPGCGMSYPFTLEQVDINIADPSGFGLPAGSGVGTLTFQINILDAATPGDPCTEPGAQIASSGNIVAAYNDEGTRFETILFNQVLTSAFFIEYKFISWTGPGPEVPSPLWDDVFRPLCRQWITNDGGTTMTDFTDFFTGGDLGWVDITIDGTGTAGGGPPNDDCTGVVNQALNAGGSITFNGDNTGATDDGQGLGFAQTWESFTTTECLDIMLEYCGSSIVFGNVFIRLYDGCPFANFEQNVSWNATDCVDGNITVYWTNVPAGTWYYPVLADVGSEGAYTINVTGTACTIVGPPANDECNNAIELTPNSPCTSITGSTLGATESLPPITCNGFLSSDALDVWFSFVATNTAHDVEVTGSGDFDAIVEFFEGTCLGLVSLDCADATVGGETEVIMASGLTIGNTYYVRVYAWDGGAVDTDFDICVIGTTGIVNNSPNFEGFEGADFPPLCWDNLDEDGDGEFWFRDGTPGVAPHTGDSCAVSASWLDGTILFPENYLILPQVTPGVDEHLTYWVAGQDPAYPAEHYGIVVSTTGMAAADFSTELFSETLVDEIWVERTVDLSAYQGMDIYIAFKHYNVSDQFWMKIDDVQFPTETTPCGGGPANDDCANAQAMNVYPQVDCPGNATSGTTVGATHDGNDPDCDATTDDFLDVWYSFNSGNNVEVHIDLSNITAGDLYVEVLDACNGTSIYCNVNVTEHLIPVSANTDYWVRVVTNTQFGMPGTYDICIWADVATDIVEVGIEDFSIFPNPASSFITLSNNGSSVNANVELMDMNGKVVLTTERSFVSNGDQILDLNELAPGVYMLSLTNNDGLEVRQRLFIK